MAQFAWNVCNPRLDVWVLRPSPVWGAPARHILGQSVWMGSDCVCVCDGISVCVWMGGGHGYFSKSGKISGRDTTNLWYENMEVQKGGGGVQLGHFSLLLNSEKHQIW